jgi:predicted nucleic-acid-binding protein
VIGIDTSVLVRLLTGDDSVQMEKTLELVRDARAAGEGVYVGAIVLAEAAWVLSVSYDFDRETLATAMERILDTAEFTVEDRALVASALIDYRHGKAQFADHLIGARNRAAGCRITATFDRGLSKSPDFRVL